ncbi:hypothetical protein ACMZ78_05075 [Gardnerella swidsinskii]|jgi:hypothetical protein|uniref:hypothetical protein n=1 Tax=Gardnerella TaxID=2701 RepID=UPI0005399178|nr:hypothetical protein [Gardnerella swidsinskii]MDK8691689.1 hypothetical protein [Gardnerella swidsinskii]NSX39353.1 hypothetical protein [Gardnerella vaginalis]
MRIKDILRVHILCAIALIIFGFFMQKMLNSYLSLNSYFFNNNLVKITVTNNELVKIFCNNICLFSLVAITPVVNAIFFIFQFFVMGSVIYTIQHLSIQQQFILLFRHSIFEVLALLLSIYISYRLLILANDYTIDKITTNETKRVLKHLLLIYFVIVIITFFGACLEWSANVVL